VPLVFPWLTALVRRINDEISRIEAEEEAAEELLLERQRQINEALARLSRLRRMKKSLRTKGREMIRRDLSSMEELEEEERKEAEEKARKEELERVQQQEREALAQMQQACSSEVIDWSGVEFNDASLSELLGNVAQGDFGGTPSTGAERSSGA
jgi:maltooligosyltrehalose synthase